MKKRGLRGRNITVKLKTDKFVLMTRARTRQNFVNEAADLYATASALLLKELQCVRPV